MTKRMAACVALAILVLAAGQTARADGVQLRLRLEKGDVLTQTITTVQQIRQTFMGNPMDMTQEMAFELTQRVTDVDAEGTASVQMVYDAVRFRQKAAQGEFIYDSKEPEAASHPMARGFTALVGQALTMKFHADGRVSDVQGSEAIAARLVESMGLTEGPQKDMALQQFKEQFGADAIRQSLEQAMKIYPEGPVDVGDSWDAVMTLKQTFPATIASTYTVSERRDGVTFLDVKGAVTSDPEAKPMEMGPLKMTYKLDGTQSGTVEIVEANGLSRKSVIEQKLEGTVRIEGMPGQAAGQNMPMSIVSTFTVTTDTK
ncbi:MAG: hypothetical protein JXR94_09645 [Candidatus Hydrogenedentes bacterium]|nr:hypothetical protein [Candidatus Hydrogenedentota bacterium]